jgi:signal transduction histidine kinase
MTTETATTAPPGRPPLWRIVGQAALVSLACLLVGALVFLLMFVGTLAEAPWAEDSDRFAVVVLLDLVVGVLLAIAAGPMRRTGMWNLVLVLPAALCSSFGIAAAAVGLARIGERRSLRTDLLTGALSVLAGAGNAFLLGWALQEKADVLWSGGIAVAFTVPALLWGRVRGTRAALVTSLRLQARTARREQEAAGRAHAALTRQHAALVAQAEAEQRAAIARDMHDSLSHHLSVIAMNAGAIAYREDMAPEQVRRSARTIQDSARAANADLRTVLGDLRGDSTPLPTVGDIDALVVQARTEGATVDLDWDGLDAAELASQGSALVVTVVRAVQELLTNAQRHAPGSPLTLRIGRAEGADDEDADAGDARGRGTLVIRAANARQAADPPPPDPTPTSPFGLPVAETPVPPAPPGAAPFPAQEMGTGTGLIGLRERARLLGGELHIIDDATTFTVEVTLPWKQPTR